MPFKKGQGKSGGRQKGDLNKLTRTVKEVVLEAFNQLQEDPKVNILAFAKGNPKEFYQIAAKLIPTEVNAHLDAKIINVIVPK